MATKAAFVSFGTPNFSQARNRLISSLNRFGVSGYSCFGIDSPPLHKAQRENREIFREKRGYGCWLWKPYIIAEAMNNAAPDSLIFYTDIAVELVGDPAPLFDIVSGSDLALFRVGKGERQRRWTKRDAFVLLGADNGAYWDDEQVNGAFILLRNNRRTKDFLGAWLAALRDPRISTDMPNTQGLPNLPEFIAHRHDQSALSILASRERLPVLRDPSQWGRRGAATTGSGLEGSPRFLDVDFGQVFNHHRQRNRSLAKRLKKGFSLGGARSLFAR